MDHSPPGSSVHGILQARILEWVAISFSWGSSWPRDRTQVSRISGRCFNLWATREAPIANSQGPNRVWTAFSDGMVGESLKKDGRGQRMGLERQRENDQLTTVAFHQAFMVVSPLSASIQWESMLRNRWFQCFSPIVTRPEQSLLEKGLGICCRTVLEKAESHLRISPK